MIWAVKIINQLRDITHLSDAFTGSMKNPL